MLTEAPAAAGEVGGRGSIIPSEIFRHGFFSANASASARPNQNSEGES